MQFLTPKWTLPSGCLQIYFYMSLEPGNYPSIFSLDQINPKLHSFLYDCRINKWKTPIMFLLNPLFSKPTSPVSIIPHLRDCFQTLILMAAPFWTLSLTEHCQRLNHRILGVEGQHERAVGSRLC